MFGNIRRGKTCGSNVTLLLVRIALVLAALISAEPWAAGHAPPTVSSVYPIGHQGQNMPTVIIKGSGFQSGPQCSFDSDVTVNSCAFNSDTQITAAIQVSPTAALGWHAITITNPDDQSGTISMGLFVDPPQTPNQVATFSFQPSDSGTITVPLPQVPQLFSTLIVGVSFWPVDITSVTVNELGSGESAGLKRGLASSIFHDGPGGPFYTNFYYGPHHGYRLVRLGPDTITLNFSGGATYALIAVAEVSELSCLDCEEQDQSAYNESLSETSSWSSGSATVTSFNEYLFSWGATEVSNPVCSNPASDWTLESQTNDPAGATVCLLDQFAEAPGFSHQASVDVSQAENYGMEIATFAHRVVNPTIVFLTSVNPSFGGQGRTLSNVVISGGNFDSNTVCSFGEGITVNSCTPTSSTQLIADITISSTAALGPGNVTVTKTTDNIGATLADSFAVTEGSPPPAPTGSSVSPNSEAQGLPGMSISGSKF